LERPMSERVDGTKVGGRPIKIRVKGGTEAQNATWSKRITAEVNRLEEELERRNKVVADIKNRGVMQALVQSEFKRRFQ